MCATKEKTSARNARGNKRLANPSCQFNLATNPSEMLISPLATVCLTLSSFVQLLWLTFVRCEATLYFRTQKIPRARANTNGNCVQSMSAKKTKYISSSVSVLYWRVKCQFIGSASSEVTCTTPDSTILLIYFPVV